MASSQPYACIHLQDSVWRREERIMVVLVIVLFLLLIGSVPAWPYSREWGYLPGSGIGLILLLLIVLLLTHIV